MGGTGNIRTQRYQSSTCGTRTMGSILASSGGGAGGFRRLSAYYVKQGDNSFFKDALGLNYGQFAKKN